MHIERPGTRAGSLTINASALVQLSVVFFAVYSNICSDYHDLWVVCVVIVVSSAFENQPILKLNKFVKVAPIELS